jgi:hypothetical protein
MATFEFSARRFLLAGGFAVATVAAPALIAFTAPTAATTSPLACPAGEEEDQFTGICTPHTVPNSPYQSIPGNPDLPSIDGIPCTGRNTGECIGLSEEQGAPFVPPQSTVGHSPTVT